MMNIRFILLSLLIQLINQSVVVSQENKSKVYHKYFLHNKGHDLLMANESTIAPWKLDHRRVYSIKSEQESPSSLQPRTPVVKSTESSLENGSLSNIKIQHIPRHLTIWVNAFIPNDLTWLNITLPNGVSVIPGPFDSISSSSYIKLPNAGRISYIGAELAKTFAQLSFNSNLYFNDNQRSYSNSRDASSKVRAGMVIDLLTGEKLQDLGITGTTIAYDSAGRKRCEAQAPTEAAKITNYEVDRKPSQIIIQSDINIRAGNPCTIEFGTPNIDAKLKVKIASFIRNEKPSSILVSIDGGVDEFPAFESYMSIDDEKAHTLFRRYPEYGNSPWDLYGGGLGLRPVSNVINILITKDDNK